MRDLSRSPEILAEEVSRLPFNIPKAALDAADARHFLEESCEGLFDTIKDKSSITTFLQRTLEMNSEELKKVLERDGMNMELEDIDETCRTKVKESCRLQPQRLRVLLDLYRKQQLWDSLEKSAIPSPEILHDFLQTLKTLPAVESVLHTIPEEKRQEAWNRFRNQICLIAVSHYVYLNAEGEEEDIDDAIGSLLEETCDRISAVLQKKYSNI